jgi:hypothetical protein
MLRVERGEEVVAIYLTVLRGHVSAAAYARGVGRPGQDARRRGVVQVAELQWPLSKRPALAITLFRCRRGLSQWSLQGVARAPQQCAADDGGGGGGRNSSWCIQIRFLVRESSANERASVSSCSIEVSRLIPASRLQGR